MCQCSHALSRCGVAIAFGFHFDNALDRDLKPENVLIGADGNLCLTDFGLSKESVQDNELVHTFVGTTEYLAPEILRQRGYSKAVDWWSLGVLLCVTHLKHCSCRSLLILCNQLRDGCWLAPVLFQKQAAHVPPHSVGRNQFPRGNGRQLCALDTVAANKGTQEALGQASFPLAIVLFLHLCSSSTSPCLNVLLFPIPYRSSAAAAMALPTSGHTLFSRALTGPP